MKRFFSLSNLLKKIKPNQGFLRVKILQKYKVRFILAVNPVESYNETHTLTICYNRGAGYKKGMTAQIIFPTTQTFRLKKYFKKINRKFPPFFYITKNANKYYPV
jgi:hypothetical protein